MRFTKRLLFVCVMLSLSTWASADEGHHHPAGGSEKLGTVNLPVSCSTEAQQQFNRATALLHSFEYEQAEQAFSRVRETDPDCTMASWGIAMSNYHPLWFPPTPEELQKGAAVVELSRAGSGKTNRERDYIAAIATFYTDADHLDHRTRTLAYERAMEQMHRRYPEDREAAIFYALALNATALPTDKTYTNQKKAVEILNTVLREEPNHPGVAHYIIHNFDYPELAPLALPAARSYAKIAPSAAHALHMPSHIFTRLGLWQESIQTNLASAAAARVYVAKAKIDGRWFDEIHAMDYLTYAYLQQGQDVEAKRVHDELLSIYKVHPPEQLGVAYAFAAIPARYALERRSWSEATGLNTHPEEFPWERFPQAQALRHFARSLGAARSGDTANARKEVEKLQSLRDRLAEAKQSYWAEQVEIQRRAAAAWLAHAEGKNEEAVTLMRSAADLEDATEKHPVTPGPIVPARELLGELFLELEQPAQALSEFETSLRASPNRFNGLSGAARSAQLAGNAEKARTYYAQLVSLCDHADGTRPELAEARTFLAKR